MLHPIVPNKHKHQGDNIGIDIYDAFGRPFFDGKFCLGRGRWWKSSIIFFLQRWILKFAWPSLELVLIRLLRGDINYTFHYFNTPLPIAQKKKKTSPSRAPTKTIERIPRSSPQSSSTNIFVLRLVTLALSLSLLISLSPFLPPSLSASRSLSLPFSVSPDLS